MRLILASLSLLEQSDALDFRFLSELLARHVGGEASFLRPQFTPSRSRIEKGRPIDLIAVIILIEF